MMCRDKEGMDIYNEHDFEALQVHKYMKYPLKWSGSKRREIYPLCNEDGYFPKHDLAPLKFLVSLLTPHRPIGLTYLHISNTKI